MTAFQIDPQLAELIHACEGIGQRATEVATAVEHVRVRLAQQAPPTTTDKLVGKPRVVNKAIVIDHAINGVTMLDNSCVAGEIQPILNLPIDCLHQIMIKDGSWLGLIWHPSYRWFNSAVYTPSGGTDIVEVVAGPGGIMLARVEGYDYK